jgi:hypothetical protein
MVHSTGGADPDGWVIWDNGYISTDHAFVPEQTTLTVRAKADPALGVWPHMVVSVGGVQVGEGFVTSSTWSDYEFEFLAPGGTEEVRVAFDNDYYAPPYHDRNLYVDRVVVECASSCDDEVWNGSETDVDCGGGECPTCPDGSSCEVNADCESENCSGAVCAPGNFNYDFESGTMGWTFVESPATSTTTTSLFKYSGFKSLKVNVSGSGNPRVWVSPPEPVPSGATLTFHVLIPSSAPVTDVQPYVADAAWQWNQGWYPVTAAMKGAWQTFTVDVSETAATPVQEVGIKMYLSGSYAGAVYVDRVEW